MVERLKSAIGIGFVTIAESQIFPFLLSSAFTARTVVKEKDQVKEVQTDLWIALAMSVGFALFMGWMLRDAPTVIFGVVLGFLMYYIYVTRGELD